PRTRCFRNLAFFSAAEEFVALNGGHNSHAAFFAVFGALHAAQAAYADWSGQGNLVRKRQKNIHWRAFLHSLGEEKIDYTRTDIAGFGSGFPHSCARSPTYGKRQPHGKPLSGAAFRAGHGGSSLIEGPVYPGDTQGTIGLKTQIPKGLKKYRCTRTL